MLKDSYDNFFWNELQHLQYENKRKGCFISRKGNSYNKNLNISRFKLRKFQELGLLSLLKK